MNTAVPRRRREKLIFWNIARFWAFTTRSDAAEAKTENMTMTQKLTHLLIKIDVSSESAALGRSRWCVFVCTYDSTRPAAGRKKLFQMKNKKEKKKTSVSTAIDENNNNALENARV